MKSNKNILIIIGVILIVLQVLSLFGLSNSDYGLYPDNSIFLSPGYSSDAESGLSFRMVLHAMSSGIERFTDSFGTLSDSDEYTPPSSTQMTSAMIREGLGCNDGGGFGLIVYDTVATIFYLLAGIIGIILVIVGIRAKRKMENTDYSNYPEEQSNGSDSDDPDAPAWERFLK